jgi:hypothetical protein
MRKEDEPRAVARLAVALWLVLLVWLGASSVAPPPVVPETAPATEFSAARAMRYLRVIAAKPHPVGSLENQRAREYLVEQLATLGLDPQVQEATGFAAGGSLAATVHNILGRMKGTTPGRALALVAHYDSVPAGPGAGDDGAGVAALLETARALHADQATLRNDLVFLFTDGEEVGSLGAQAFVAENPAAKEISLVLNFEGRGDTGPSLMFETSAENGWLIDQLTAAAPHPRAASLFAAAYSEMPNDTDLSVFKRAGFAGMNFAFIGSPKRYHTPEDTPENLDPRSLQHHGSYALALARRFGNLDLANRKQPDEIFFNIGAGLSWFVNYPAVWAKPIGTAVALLFVVVGAFGFGGGHLKLGGIALGVLALAIGLFLVWRGASAFVFGLFALHRRWLPPGPVADSVCYALSGISLAAMLTAILWELVRRAKWGSKWQSLAFVGLAAWTALAILSAFYFPAGSYLFAWPALASLLAVGAVFAGAPLDCFWTAAVLALGAAPGVLLIVPLIQLVLAAFGVNFIGVVATGMLIMLLLWSLVPVVVGMQLRRWLLVLSSAAAVGFLSLGAESVRYTHESPRHENVFYLHDEDTGKSVWLSLNFRQGAPPDPWAAQYVSASPERTISGDYFALRGEFPLFQHEAPMLALEPPDARLIEESTQDGKRVLRLLLRSPRHARELQLIAGAEGAKVSLVAVNGKLVEQPKPVGMNGVDNSARAGAPPGQNAPPDKISRLRPSGSDRVFMGYAGAPEGGIEITLAIEASVPSGAVAPARIKLTDYSDGLPEIPGRTFHPRPADVSMQHFADMTMVTKSYSF